MPEEKDPLYDEEMEKLNREIKDSGRIPTEEEKNALGDYYAKRVTRIQERIQAENERLGKKPMSDDEIMEFINNVRKENIEKRKRQNEPPLKNREIPI